MTDRAAPYVLAAGQTRRDDAILPFKALANDTGGLLSACELTLGPWESGPVLHRHTEVNEAFYVVAGKLEASWTTGGSRRGLAGSCGCRGARPTASPTPARGGAGPGPGPAWRG